MQRALETFSVLTWILTFTSWSLFHVHGFNSGSVTVLVSFATGPWVSCRLSVVSCFFLCICTDKSLQNTNSKFELLSPWAAGARVPIKFGSPVGSLMKRLGNVSYWYENVGVFCDTLWSLGRSLIEGWLNVPANNICSAICVCVSFNCHTFSSLS